jgi:DNA-binding response OmpR family regulator
MDNPSHIAGETYDDGYLRVEHDNYYLAFDGRSVLLPRKEFLLLSCLARTPGRVVPAGEIWRAVWGDIPVNAESLHVHIYRLRRKLSPFGLQLETMVNVGYRLLPSRRPD